MSAAGAPGAPGAVDEPAAAGEAGEPPAPWGSGRGEPDLVRPFIVTGGRTRASRPDIRVETLIEALPETTYQGLPEERAVLAAATSPTSIAEIGAHTGLPLGVVTILTGDLLDAGAVRLHHTDPVDIEVSALTRMIERVRAL